jgi:membrane protease YdiL (CAAX protease family)
LVWAAFHFTADFRHTTEDYQILLRFAFRIATCIAMSYVLGWLALRSVSIWPAALAHGLNNIWAFSPSNSAGGLSRALIPVCWGLLGFVLFRFWPPSIWAEDPDQAPEIKMEPSL